MTSERSLHWFILPIFLYGILIGVDVVDWLRGRYDLFDPAGMFAVLVFYYFFLHPVLWVMLDIEMLYFDNPPDWRPWFGLMGCLNVFGILAYKAGEKVYNRRQSKRVIYLINWKAFLPLASLLIGLGLVSWTLLMARYGGSAGIIATFGSRDLNWLEQRSASAGDGTFFIFIAPLPGIALIIAILYLWRRRKPVTWRRVALLFVLFAGLLIIFNSRVLFGSRSSVIFPLAVAVGIIHYTIKKFGRTSALAGTAVLMGFLYLGGLYKGLGTEVFTKLSFEQFDYYEQSTKRDIKFVLFEDLGVAATQAYLAYRLVEYPGAYTLRWGKTYPLTVVYLLIPRQVWPDKPLTSAEVVAGTDLMRGEGYRAGEQPVSKVYGLAGEAMLNFHFFGVPFVYWCMGLLTGWYRRTFLNLRPYDARRFIAPIFSFYLAIWFLGNLSNIFGLFVLHGNLVIVLLVLASMRRVSPESALCHDSRRVSGLGAPLPSTPSPTRPH